MRLLFLTGSLAHGGAEHHAITLANRLAERGHDCHMAWVKPEAAQRNRIELRGGDRAVSLDAGRYLDRRAVERLAAVLRRYRPSALIAANPYALMYASMARARAGMQLPLIVTYHSTRSPGLKEQLQLLAYRLYMWAAERAVFVCEYQRRYCMRRGLRSRRNSVIHNGVDVERFRDTVGPQERRALRSARGDRDSD
jgi:glycosyltransferase involved in cell wall biosynthesis